MFCFYPTRHPRRGAETKDASSQMERGIKPDVHPSPNLQLPPTVLDSIHLSRLTSEGAYLEGTVGVLLSKGRE
eukprot:scaffold44_cov339-Pavlova_lutheri.AAC.23